MPLRLVWSIFLIITLLMNTACTLHSNKQKLAEQFYIKSSLEKQTEQIPYIVRQILADNKKSSNEFSSIVYKKLDDVIAQKLNAGALRSTIIEQLELNLTVQDLTDVLSWLDSPLGKKITRLETDATKPEAIEHIRELVGKPLEKVVPPKRVKLLTDLDEVTGTTEFAVDLEISIQATLFFVLNTVNQQGNNLLFEKFRKALIKNRYIFREGFRRETMAGFCYTYSELTDNEIKRYITFYKLSSSQKAYATAIRAIKEKFLETTKEMERVIAVHMDEQSTYRQRSKKKVMALNNPLLSPSRYSFLEGIGGNKYTFFLSFYLQEPPTIFFS